MPAPALSPEAWQGFLDVLRLHGVYPLMAYRLRVWPADCRPLLEVVDYLNRIFLYAAARSMRAGRQIQAVVDALEAAGIESVLLKGPALARTVYPDPALRQSVDIDLLVRPGDVLAAESVLEGLGYVSPKKEFHVSQHEFHHQVFEAPGDGMPLELHWALDTEFDMFPEGWVEEVITRRIPIRADDLLCHAPSHADHLLFLAFHNVFVHRSEGARLDRIFDTAQVMAQMSDEEDWQTLIDRSVEHHIRIPLELTAVSAALWGGPLPDGFENYAAWPTPSERETTLWKYSATRKGSVYSWLYLMVQGQPGVVEKFRFGYRFVVPPTPMMGKFRRSDSPIDLPIAHLRRWFSIVKYI